MDPEATIALLSKIFAGLPKLSGAQCVGQWELFDARGEDEDADAARQRHAKAVALCHRCPALTACEAFTAGERDVGQVRAGRLPTPPQRGRPKKAS